MNGIFGWLGTASDPVALTRRIASGHGRQSEVAEQTGTRHGLGATQSRRTHLHVEPDVLIALTGAPRFDDPQLAMTAQQQGIGAALARAWRAQGDALPKLLAGSFALAIIEPARARALLALDRMGIERLCYAEAGGILAFGTEAGQAAAHPALAHRIDPQALYDYFYFHTIPAPRTVYAGVSKLLPGECLVWQAGTLNRHFYWQADYTPAAPDFPALRSEFHRLLDTAVASTDGGSTAAFLSGGTDSSTVVGALTRLRRAPVDTFSIGFDAAGFDEMDYARCAAERFASRATEYYLTPADIVSAIPVIAESYDEPFGNNSAVPTYFCALRAREAGFERMLAGDGGDEIFGGNARYAKQGLFEHYSRLPAAVRRGLIEPLAHLPGLSTRFPLRKLRSYVDQAKVGLPLRLEAYNFLKRTPLAEIFEADFLSCIDPEATDRALTEVYERTASPHYLNRLMHLDLKFTLADNDLRKVGTMCEAAGIEVAYPLLDDRLVGFAHRLPPDYKVRGQQLRWFFKAALADLLPEKIIRKSKHGFGLPFGVWVNQHAPLAEIVHDSLADLRRRRIVRPAYLDWLQAQQGAEHASYYGVMVWVAMMLERWMAAHGH